jgi:multidrug efflux system membrane fusion protein
LNARIERGEFGEEIKKLPEEERRKRLRDLIREGQAPRSGNAQ